MAHQPTQTIEETDVFGNNEDWGEDNDYYDQRLTKMSEDWERDVKPQKEGLGKDIKAWRYRQTTPYAKPHPREQHPVKLAPFPTDRETMRVPLRADRHVVVQSFRDKVYVNIREFYRHDVVDHFRIFFRGDHFRIFFRGGHSLAYFVNIHEREGALSWIVMRQLIDKCPQSQQAYDVIKMGFFSFSIELFVYLFILFIYLFIDFIEKERIT